MTTTITTPVTATGIRDEALCAAACAALRYSGYRALERLACEVEGGVLTLSGVVASFYLKQVAQAALWKLPMLRAVNNLVQVAQARSDAGASPQRPLKSSA
jgi:hypothetical protein